MKKIPYEQNNLTDLTEEQIEDFKKQYGEVYTIGDDEVKCFIHRPTRQIMDAASAVSANTGKDSKFNETILKNCWLAGDKRMLEQDDYFYGAAKLLNKITIAKDLELKNC